MKLQLATLLAAVVLVLGDESTTVSDDDFTCSFGGKEYKLGEQIETPDTACFICTCRRGFVKPGPEPPNHCAIVDCPWGYYSSKPHCSTEYVAGKCCPELRCSAPPPKLDAAYLSGKRLDESTDGYEITAKVESELTIYCTAQGSGDLSDKTLEWKHKKLDGSETTVTNTTDTSIAFFPPSAWALYFPKLKASDDGVYTCTIPTTPPQTQTTRIIVRTEPRPPVIDAICFKPAFADTKNDPCPQEVDEFNLPWYYNTTAGSCTQHTENSCKWAKENHFPTMTACWDHCLDDCYASSEAGQCDALIEKFYYNHMNDRCQTFNYGGCGGNRNRFDTMQECEDKCAEVKYRQAPDINKSIKKRRSTSCNVYAQCPWKLWLHYVHSNCQSVYEDDSCCPVAFDCKVETTNPTEDPSTTCTYKGKTYNFGDEIEMQDECLSCTCNQGFDPLNNVQALCRPLNCDGQEMDTKLEKGCIPIYKTDKCCPTDWQCPPSLNTKFRQGGEETRPTTDDPHKQCYYGGQNYPVGFDLVSGYKLGINCTCVTPPTFTCTVPSCPEVPSVSDEMLRCKEVFKWPLEGFCPEYKCWNILEETDHVGLPKSAKEKRACEVNPCVIEYNQCTVNYTECHLGECTRQCEVCAIPSCSAWSKYETPPNECPRCASYTTPEETCELNHTFCPDDSRCHVLDEDNCRQGSCQPVCILPVQQIFQAELAAESVIDE